jgi:Flp pilus assembly protein TadG
MVDANHKPPAPCCRSLERQRGTAAVEFALIALVFFTLVFGILEVARAMYLFNTLQEVTRRAAALAANSRFDQDTLNSVRYAALFRDSDGTLALGSPVVSANVKIDYLSLARNATTGELTPQLISTLPSSPERNRITCLANPYDANCIRLIRVRICQPDGGGDGCTRVPYQMLFPVMDFPQFTLPRAETIVPAQTLGYVYGSIPGL